MAQWEWVDGVSCLYTEWVDVLGQSLDPFGHAGFAFAPVGSAAPIELEPVRTFATDA